MFKIPDQVRNDGEMVSDRASGSVGARNLWPPSAALEGGAPRLRSRAAGRDEDSKNPRVSAPILSEATENDYLCFTRSGRRIGR